MDSYSTRVLTVRSIKRDITTCTILRDGFPFMSSVLDATDMKHIDGDISSILRDSDELRELGIYASSLSRSLSSDGGVLNKLKNKNVVKQLSNLAESCFSSINPNTGKQDLVSSDYFSHLVPVVVGLNIVPAQVDENDTIFFNPSGTLSRAEYFYILGRVIANSRKPTNSIDGVCQATDYFEVGYNSVVDSYGSYLYRFYTRQELIEPITRCEMAYITVVCWKYFSGIDLIGGQFPVGINLDWGSHQIYMRNFIDTENLNIECLFIDNSSLVDVDIRNYRRDLKLGVYLNNIKNNTVGLPIPYFMSLLELDSTGVFNFNGELAPLREVSRGEVAYLLVNLANYIFNYSTKV